MKVQKVWAADIYRDGGSYGFCFDSDDGHWYEFFLQTTAFEESSESHRTPVIYLEGVNDKKAVRELTWQEAKVFVAPLRCGDECDEKRFQELLDIVMREGRKPE